MRLEQTAFRPETGWVTCSGTLGGLRPQLALVFGGRRRLEDPATLANLRTCYPGARLVLGSTAGEFTDTSITDEALSVTAMALEDSQVLAAAVTVRSQLESHAAGAELAKRLAQSDLRHLFVLSDGQRVNGTQLACGFNENLGREVTLTGGLAGDGDRFECTVTGLDEAPRSGRIVAVGFYGNRLQVGFGSNGGWNAAGAEHTVTRADGNILWQLDGESALALYQRHLGAAAAELPAAALRFPLYVTSPGTSDGVVRTILSVEETTQCLVFAGDVPAGSRVRFMHASPDDIVQGAGEAAAQARGDPGPQLAICISCFGRRLVLGDRAADELVRVRQVLGPRPVLAGFYSYGELAPAGRQRQCQLHNQTMTITTLREG